MGFAQHLLMVCAGILTCLLMVFMLLGSKFAARKKLRLPPSPAGSRPILGHLPILQLPLHQTLHKLAQQYGPFVFIRMGSSSAVVVSSPDWAREIMHMHDREFLDRPQFEASKRFYNNKSMIFMEYGSTWRDLRKLYTIQILSSKRIEMFENVRHEEMAELMALLKSHAAVRDGVAVDLRKLVFNTAGNMMTRMLFSRQSFTLSVAGTESGFKQMIEEMVVLTGTPVLGDLIPWLSWFDPQGSKKKMDELAVKVDAFFEDIVAGRIESRGVKVDADEDMDSDYLDLLLHMHTEENGTVDRESIKSILLDLLSTGAESSSTTVEWALAELIKNPDCMKKLQQELDTLVAQDGAVNTTSKCIKDVDIRKLSYLQALVKETLRLHPPFSIIYRQLRQDIENGIQVRGYDLPKKTRVLVNLWSMGRDTTSWGKNADTFCPERFLDGSSVPDLYGKHFEFLPFGTGRRVCPGMNMALTLVPFILANLVHVFDWEMPNGAHVDLSEAASLSSPKAEPLVVLPILRAGSEISVCRQD